MPRTIVVIGAGISGLAASLRLSTAAAGVGKIILLEASGHVGGWLQTTRTQDGAVFEHGPRGVRPAGKVGKNTLQMVSELGLESDVLPVTYSHVASKNRFLFIGGKLCKLPSGLRSAFVTCPPFTQPIIRSLVREPFVRRGEDYDESVHSFAARRFGKELAEIAIDGLCRGIFAGNSRKLSVRSCFPTLFEAERKFGSVLIGMIAGGGGGGSSKDPRFTSELVSRAQAENWAQWTLRKGMKSLPEAMEQELQRRGVEIHRDTPVNSVQQTPDGAWEVHLDGGTMNADHIFSSVPAKVLNRILPQSWVTLCDSLREIDSVSVTVVNLEYDGSILPVTGFGHLVPSQESGEILGVVYDSCSYPQQDRMGPPTTRLTVMMGGSWFQEAFGDPDTVPQDHLLQRATETVRSHLGVTQTPLRAIIRVQKGSALSLHIYSSNTCWLFGGL
ncbi:protoporphyrinogen oxidase isoform X2 [Stegostoma tigrinum]|uniref:protoporphyrinogen oxidase isoform X2 n=1 Tax=Stegostoma tigrinum TaxID=3053191 RepID=UPI0028708CCB|nr:protoporphyrinogen oxidase isoform X2 [Stegostoma tigrinum]